MIAVKVGSRWAAVEDYGQDGCSGHRQGFWCEDRAGGWGTSRKSPEDAVRRCARPVLYRTKREAESAA